MLTDDEQAQAIKMPVIKNLLIYGDYLELCEMVNPMTQSDSHGLDQYRLTVHLVKDQVLILNCIWLLHSK